MHGSALEDTNLMSGTLLCKTLRAPVGNMPAQNQCLRLRLHSAPASATSRPQQHRSVPSDRCQHTCVERPVPKVLVLATTAREGSTGRRPGAGMQHTATSCVGRANIQTCACRRKPYAAANVRVCVCTI